MDGITNSIAGWDRSAFSAINGGLKSPLLDQAMPLITDLGLFHVQLAAIVIVAIGIGIHARGLSTRRPWFGLNQLFAGSRWWFAPMLLALTLSGLASIAIKQTIPRDRPHWFYYHEHRAQRHLDVKVETVAGRDPMRVASFPSGHTATSCAIAAVVTLLLWKRRALLLIILLTWLAAFLVGVSRIYIADHWPLDVLGGAVLGTVCALLALGICRYRERGRSGAGASLQSDSVVHAESPACGTERVAS